MISIKEARKELWPDYDELSDEKIEIIIRDFTKLASLVVDMAWEEHEKEKKN